MKIIKNDEAVSPVIGVILMVAITVILAAVIAAFVFGLAGTTQTTKNVAATARTVNQTAISVTYQGGQDHNQVGALNITWPSGAIQNITTPEVGQSWIATGTANATSDRDHIVVTALFNDGSRQVILDTYV